MSKHPILLTVEPLTAAGFAPFGDVIEAPAVPGIAQDIASIVPGTGGKPKVSALFTKVGNALPLRILKMERHPLGTQAFVPMAGGRFFVVVHEPGPGVDPARIRAFVTNGRQGTNYRPGTWHHSFIAAAQGDLFLILERGGVEPNCDFADIDTEVTVVG